MIPTCKTCKWWGGPNDKTVFVRGAQLVYRQAPCNHHKMGEGEDDCATCDDGYGQIETGPDFGCIHHQAKWDVKPIDSPVKSA